MSPILNSVFPADGDVGIPLGVSILLDFDKAVDLDTINSFVVVYGNSNDQVNGPVPGTYLDKRGDKPFLFRSIGFKGLVPFSVKGTYVNSSGEEIDADYASASDEAASGSTYRVKIMPNKPLPEENVVNYQVIGDPNNIGTGVSSRTIWDSVPSLSNTSSTGLVEPGGSFTGLSEDTLVVVITSNGDVGTAQYTWYWESLGSSSNSSRSLTNPAFITLDGGVAVRFTGTSFSAGDEFRINVSPKQRLESSFKVSFTTSDNEYAEVPESPSTPAECSPPSNVIPPMPGFGFEQNMLRVIGIDPESCSYDISLHTDEIIVKFSEPIDPSTISKDTVKLFAVPVLGIYGKKGKKRELAYKLTLSGDTLIISF